jgi:hypothetical protein
MRSLARRVAQGELDPEGIDEADIDAASRYDTACRIPTC